MNKNKNNINKKYSDNLSNNNLTAVETPLDTLRNKDLSEIKTDFHRKHERHDDDIKGLLTRIATLEGYNNGYNKGTTKTWDIILRTIPILISIIALVMAIIK